MTDDPSLKRAVYRHWNDAPCGTREIPAEDRRRFFADLERERYELEPYIRDFARFEEGRGRRVLEIGVGAGTDFVQWVRAGADATGVDLTDAGVALTRERLALEGLQARVEVADAEALPFADASFDLVYSYGVLHHSPDTPRAIAEVRRVLRPGGRARIMMYHHPSWTGLMLWGVHCLARGRPWQSPRWAMFHHLESPGTKAYTVAEAEALFVGFTRVAVRTHLSHGDLLRMRPAAKYQGLPHRILWCVYPRPLIRRMGHGLGNLLLIEASR